MDGQYTKGMRQKWMLAREMGLREGLSRVARTAFSHDQNGLLAMRKGRSRKSGIQRAGQGIMAVVGFADKTA